MAAELSTQEFVDELVAELEDRMELHFEPVSKATIERTLRMEIIRADREEHTDA